MNALIISIEFGYIDNTSLVQICLVYFQRWKL